MQKMLCFLECSLYKYDKKTQGLVFKEKTLIQRDKYSSKFEKYLEKKIPKIVSIKMELPINII